MKKIDCLIIQMRELEQEIMCELRRKEAEFLYQVRMGRIRFTKEAAEKHRRMRTRIHRFLLESSLPVLATVPIIWFCLLPLAFLDLTISAYQVLCFGIYGIPKVPRGEYFQFDRRRLKYLNFIERLNCEYCAYGNGVLAFATEVAARTEQYWCPIKHALRVKSMHSRYRFFFDYGDAEHYKQQLETVRRSFEDVSAEDTGSPDRDDHNSTK